MFIKGAMAQGIDPVAVGTIATQGAGELFEMGVLGVFLVCCMAFIVFIHISHRRERKEWREEQKEESVKRDNLYAETAKTSAEASNKLADSIAQLSRDIYRNGNGGTP